MRKALQVIGVFLVMAIGGFGAASVASADQPPAPPGKDPCSHGNTGKPCRPDPQPDKGKDCEKHGKEGGVNEDHCKGETTPTTPTTTTPTTPTTTTPTTPTQTTPPTTTPAPTTPAPTTPAPVTPPPPAQQQTPPPVTPAELEEDLEEQAQDNGAPNAPPAPRATPGELPNTGLPLIPVALLGAGLSAAGLALRRKTN